MGKKKTAKNMPIVAIYRGLGNETLDVSYKTLRDIEELENAGKLKIGREYQVDFLGDDAKVRLKGFDLPLFYGVFNFYALKNGQYMHYNDEAKRICENQAYLQDGEIYY